MARGVTVTLEGAAELKAQLSRLGDEMREDALVDAVDAGLDVMLSAVDRYTPLGKTGNLRRGNKKQIWKQESGYVEGEVLNKAPHAYIVEFGHGGPNPAGPHPFLRAGFEASKSGAQNAVTNTLKQRLEAAV